MSKWPLCRIRPSHKNLPKKSQSNDTKQKTPDSYSTGVTLYSWFFCRPELKTFPKNVQENLYLISPAKNQESTEFKMADVKPVITERR